MTTRWAGVSQRLALNKDPVICSVAFAQGADHKSSMDGSTEPDDRFDLNRFVQAQEEIYSQALAEIKSSQKRSHWMWFIFPQIDGLGYSSPGSTQSKAKRKPSQYLGHPLLGKRLVESA